MSKFERLPFGVQVSNTYDLNGSPRYCRFAAHQGLRAPQR